MGWKKVEKKAEHVCDLPSYQKETGLKKGDLVECDCGRQYECIEVIYGMSYDPLPNPILRWKSASWI